MSLKRVILDTDPAIGQSFRDLDDGLAILLLLASNEVQLEGLSITFGNTKAPRAFAYAKEVLSVAKSDLPVYLGAHSREDLNV